MTQTCFFYLLLPLLSLLNNNWEDWQSRLEEFLADVPSLIARQAAERPPQGPVSQIQAMWGTKIDQVPDLHGASVPGLSGHVYLIGPKSSFPVEGNGSLFFRLTYTGQNGQPQNITCEYPKRFLDRVMSKDPYLGWGYRIFIPWESYQPWIKEVRIQVEFRPENSEPPVFSILHTFALRNEPAETPPSGVLSPDESAKLLLATAETMEQAGKYPEAIELYEKARQLDNRASAQATRHLAVILERALEEYRHAINQNPKDAKSFNNLGYGYYCRGEWESAEKQLRKAVSLDPKLATAWNNLGMCLAQQMRDDEALAAFEKVLTKAQAHCNLGFIQASQSRTAAAHRNYELAKRANPTEGETHNIEAMLARLESLVPAPFNEGETGPSGDSTKPNNSQRKPHVETLIAMAKAKVGQADEEKDENLQTSQYDQARVIYQEALKTDAKCLSAYQGLAQVYLKLKDSDRAVEILQRATQIAPKNAELWSDLAHAFNCQKEWDKAAQCLNVALKIEPENRDYQKALGFTLARAGKFEESLAVLTQAGRSAAYAHLMIAKTFEHLHQNERCKEHLELAKRANPTARETHDIEAMLASLEQSSVVPASFNDRAAPQSQLTLEDVAKLAQHNISDEIVIRQMVLTDSTYQLGADQIIWLKERNVSDAVVMVMQGRKPASPTSGPAYLKDAPEAIQPVGGVNVPSTVVPAMRYSLPQNEEGESWKAKSKLLNPPDGMGFDISHTTGYRTAPGENFWIEERDLSTEAKKKPGSALKMIEAAGETLVNEYASYRSFYRFGSRLIYSSAKDAKTTAAENESKIGFFSGQLEEWYLGSNQWGAYSFTRDQEWGLFSDLTWTPASTSGPFSIKSRTRNGIIWFPYEGVSVHFTWDAVNLTNPQTGHKDALVLFEGLRMEIHYDTAAEPSKVGDLNFIWGHPE